MSNAEDKRAGRPRTISATRYRLGFLTGALFAPLDVFPLVFAELFAAFDAAALAVPCFSFRAGRSATGVWRAATDALYRRSNRDLWRPALFGCRTPLRAARSSELMAVRTASRAASKSPPAMLSFARLIADLVALLTARFRRRLLIDCRCAFAADLVAKIPPSAKCGKNHDNGALEDCPARSGAWNLSKQQPLPYGRDRALSDLFQDKCAIDDHEPLRLSARKLQESTAYPFMELQGLPSGQMLLIAIAREAYFRRDIQKQRKVRLQPARRFVVESPDQLEAQPAPVTLIG